MNHITMRTSFKHNKIGNDETLTWYVYSWRGGTSPFFQARTELELQKPSLSRARAWNFSSSCLVEPSLQGPHFKSTANTYNFYTQLSLKQGFDWKWQTLILGLQALKKAQLSFSNSGPGFSKPRAYLLRGKNQARAFEAEPRLVPPLFRWVYTTA